MPTADQKSCACKATFLLLVLTAERKNMNSFMSWVGGKKNLRDAVLARFPPYYERYIEVFGGAGWVLFHKPPGADFEVYNDFNSNLARTSSRRFFFPPTQDITLFIFFLSAAKTNSRKVALQAPDFFLLLAKRP